MPCYAAAGSGHPSATSCRVTSQRDAPTPFFLGGQLRLADRIMKLIAADDTADAHLAGDV